MDTDQQVVVECDLALIDASKKYMQALAWDKPNLLPALNDARAKWAIARYRLLFPGTVTLQSDVTQARSLRQRINSAADNQVLIQALLDLAGLLSKFTH